jgi:hypothetical protein
MDWIKIVYWFSDGAINELLTIVARDFKVLAAMVGAPVCWALARLARKTPWTSDDRIIAAARKRLGLKEDE